MVPPPNSVRDSRHVAIRGLPHSTSEESLRNFLGRFGKLHGTISRVESQGQEIIYASFVDTRSAAHACTADRFDKNFTCRITLCNPDERNRPPDPSNFVAYFVVFDIPVGPSAQDVFEAVKAHSKRHGTPTHINLDSSNVESGWWKARVTFVKLNTEELKADESLILGKHPQFQISRLREPPNSDPPCTPSTSNLPVREVSTSTSVHVPNPDNHNRAYFERRFQKYGRVLEVQLLSTIDKHPFAIVQFGGCEHARKALRDSDFPKPLDGPSRKSAQIVVFGLPKRKPNISDQMYPIICEQHLRDMGDNVVEVKLDWFRKLGIVYFANMEQATVFYDTLKSGVKDPHYRPDFDYCSDLLDAYLFPNEPGRSNKNMQNKSLESDRRHREWTRSGSSPTVSPPRRSKTSEPKASTSRAEEFDPGDSNGDRLDRSSENDNHSGYSYQNGVHDASQNHHRLSTNLLSDKSPDYSSSPFAQQGTSYDLSESAETPTQEQEQEDDDSDNSSSRLHRRRGGLKNSGSAPSAKSSNSEPPDKKESESPSNKKRRRRKKGSDSDNSNSPSPEAQPWKEPKTPMSNMLKSLRWKSLDLARYPDRIEDVVRKCTIARETYEKTTGRPFPNFTRENELKLENHLQYDRPEHSTDLASSETEIRQREWTRYCETAEDLEEFRSHDTASLLRTPDPATPIVPTSRGSGRPSIEEARSTRLSLDLVHHPHELAQRSHSLCIGPMTPTTPFHSAQPLLVNTSTPGPSQPGPSGVMTPRSAQPPPLASPISRHGSVSSLSGRPASIQTLRHQSVMFPPDITIPPPPVPPTYDEMMSAPLTRRSSETLAPMSLRSPPFGKQIPPLLTMPLGVPPNVSTGTPTGTQSVSSSATSTPRHSISGTPVHQEVTTPKIQQQPQTPKSRPPEKVQVRHDSISKPGPSSAASALQARSQSISVPEPKKPVVRDAGSDLLDQIMSNKPSKELSKLPRIEKKSSALLNSTQNQQSVPSTPSGSVNTPALSFTVKDKEKEKRRKERELDREREARKEMKRNETKEDRQKRKEKERAERAKKEEEERRERKREKQLKKEKEKQREEKERREREEKERQKEKEKKRAEKEKRRSKKKRRRDSDTDSSESDSDEEEVKKPKTQEEKDHELALLIARGGIAEGLKSRRSGVQYGSEPEPTEKSKNRRTRVLIDSSDESDDDNDKKKSGSSNDESDTEQRHLPPPPVPPSIPVQPTKDQKQKVHKEREKGELTSSSEEEDDKEEDERREKKLKIREREDRENRKRQKSVTSYSSDDHNDRGKTVKKKKKRDDSEEKMRKKTRDLKEQKQRKRKLEHRRSSENESKRKAKRDDFRDVPLEDVSDEEEVEEASRVRRPSTSSVASTNEKKSAKTPLRVTTPSVTPLQSPKILSPKILSPKTSSSSTKRPSISDQESLVSLTSPKQRNRTTSSTSTATTASRPEISIPGKVLSPPITAKSSVSSIDDFAIREDLSATSAAASPMSATGRPVILTKAARKVFVSSPKKSQHESSSGSSSSSESSDDSSDETIVSAERTVDAAKGASGSVNRDQSPLLIPPPPVPPMIPPSPKPLVLEVLAPTEVVEPVSSPQTLLPASIESQVDCFLSPKEPEQDLQQSFISEHAEELEQSQGTSDQDDTTVEESGNMDDTLVEETGISEKTDPMPTEQPAEEVPNTAATPVEEEETVVSDGFMSPGPQDVERNETASTQPQSLISDQETDQAVQSIFNEEDEEDFPQYPDFVMSKESKDEKESPRRFDECNTALDPNRRTMEPLELDNAVASIVEKKDSPIQENHNDCRTGSSNYFNEQKRQELLRSMKGSENRTPRSDDNEVVETDREVPMEEMDTQKVFDNANSETKDSVEKQANATTQLFAQHSRLSHPEQTPTPELIPNEAIHDDVRAGNDDLRVQTQRQFPQGHSQALQSPKFYSEQLLQSPSQGNSAGSNVSAGKPVPVQHPESVDTSQYIQNACIQSTSNGPSLKELKSVFQHEAEESSQLQKIHASQVEQQKKLENSQRQRTLSDLENLMNGKKAAVGGFMHYLNPAAQTIFSSLNIDPFRARIAKEPSPVAKEPLSTSSASEQIDGLCFQRWFYNKFPIMWSGRLALKSMETSINLHYLTGRQQFLKDVLGSESFDEKPRRDSVRITQRLRLDNGQLQHIHDILNNPDFACCIGLTSNTDVESLANGDSVQSSIIDYLNKKQYAGISCLNNSDALSTARVHVFAPGPLVTQYLSELCSTLLDYVHRTNVNFLLIVFTNDKPEPSAMPSCTPSDQIVVE